MSLTEEEKQKAVEDVFSKLHAILVVNGLTLIDSYGKVFKALRMAYQQGFRDAKELIK